MNYKRAIHLLISIFMNYVLMAQASKDFLSLQNFTPPSPESIIFAKYSQVPVNLNSGIPEINIPLFEVRSGKIAIPINISYHSGGIKLDEVASPIGLEWVLNGGAEISRVIVGRPDESGVGFLYQTYVDRSALVNEKYNPAGGNFDYLKNLAEGNWDSQSDIYNYNFNGISGKFLILFLIKTS